MKTPEKIKKGLAACSADECHGQHEGCTYQDQLFCTMRMCGDALTYIQQLESLLTSAVDALGEAERERDCALADVLKNCETCKHSYMNNPDVSICAHVEYCSPSHDKWEWRGPCPENTKEGSV